VRPPALFSLVTIVLACASSAPPPPEPLPHAREVCGVGGLGALVPDPNLVAGVTAGGRKAPEGLPGTPPHLDKLAWYKSSCSAPACRGSTGVTGAALFTATHRPVELVAFTPQEEYRFHLTSCLERETSVPFSIMCKRDRGPHTVVYRFRVEDKLGRESNVVEKHLECP
jgi:hypothetical protein